MEEASESELIVELIKKCSCFYSKVDPNCRNDTGKKKYLNDIAVYISNRLNLENPLTGEDIKSKWENLRRSFVRAHKEVIEGKETGYYLYSKLLFLKDHISHIATKNCTKDEAQDELTFEDVLKVSDPQTVQKRKFQEVMSKNQSIKKSKKDHANAGHSQLASNVVPEVSQLTKQKLAKKDEMGKKITQAIDQAVAATKTIVESNDDDDCYTMAIRQSLMLIKKDNIIPCVNGILKIITKYKQKH